MMIPTWSFTNCLDSCHGDGPVKGTYNHLEALLVKKNYSAPSSDTV